MKAEDLDHFDYWNYFYEGIRKANTFIQRVNECQEVSAFTTIGMDRTGDIR